MCFFQWCHSLLLEFVHPFMSLPNKGAAHDVPFRNGCHQGNIIYGIFILSQARLCVPRRSILLTPLKQGRVKVNGRKFIHLCHICQIRILAGCFDGTAGTRVLAYSEKLLLCLQGGGQKGQAMQDFLGADIYIYLGEKANS